ncbi:MAG: response regulator [Candidatus Hydrothermarchaeaceae archaeon]
MRIMIVDDNKNFVEVLRRWMENEGYEVIKAFDGEECLEKIHEKPDIVLLDVMMPGIDGFEVCRRLKNNPEVSDIPVIILSARGDEKDVLEGFNLGAIDYFPKTFSNKILIAKVNSVIKMRKIEMELRDKIGELERFTKLSVDRELRMVELKKRIKELDLELENKKVENQ